MGLWFLCLPVLGQEAAASTNNDATTNSEAAHNTNSAASKAAAVAEQQGVEERFKQLAADMESLRAANQTLLEKLSALKDDLQQIRVEQSRLAAGGVTREDLKPLAQRIEEVDKKREEDRQTISEEIKKTADRLEKLFAANVRAEPPAGPLIKPPPRGDAPATADGFSYTIKDGDTLEAIRSAYNADFKSKGMKAVTLKQAMDANPGVDWTRLKVGQKIVIPRPAD